MEFVWLEYSAESTPAVMLNPAVAMAAASGSLSATAAGSPVAGGLSARRIGDRHCADVQPLGSRGRSLTVNFSCHGNRRAQHDCRGGVGRIF